MLSLNVIMSLMLIIELDSPVVDCRTTPLDSNSQTSSVSESQTTTSLSDTSSQALFLQCSAARLVSNSQTIPLVSESHTSTVISPEMNIFSLPEKMTDEEKIRLIQGRKPGLAFRFPSRKFVDGKNKSGITMRQFNRKYLDVFPWMYYCKSSNGVACLACILFPKDGKFMSCPTEVMVTRPHTNFKKTNADAKAHESSQSHKEATARFFAFQDSYHNPSHRIDLRMNMQEQLTVQENKEKLKSIMMPLLFCAQYGLALRGKRDHGNIMTGENATSGVFPWAFTSACSYRK